MCVDSLNYPKFSWLFSLGDFVCPEGVNFADFAYLAQWWLRTDCNLNNDCNGTDIYTDGTVNSLDFLLFAENWLEGLFSVIDVDANMSPDLAGDDNFVNFKDFAVLAGNWQKTGSGLAGDLDNSGQVDFSDIEMLCRYWLEAIYSPEH
jgi:hypothetical protein